MTTPLPPQQETQSELSRVGRDLVEVGSILSELQRSYLSGSQRREMACSLQERYLHLQRLASEALDWELRRRITHYLVVVGSVGVVAEIADEPSSTKVLSFLEALARNRLDEWIDRFYCAAHQTVERDADGHVVRWRITADVLLELEQLQRNFMHWLNE